MKTKRTQFRYYAELNDFLPPERRMRSFLHEFLDDAPVKDMIESHGVPHTEVDLILANGESVDFSYVAQDGDRISVYPVFEAIDISQLLRVRPQPLRHTRFVLDTHLGRLAAYLRMLGFDTLYGKGMDDGELARLSRDEKRILLTRDRGLLKRSVVTHGYYIRETNARLQLLEVVRRFDLKTSLAPFERCLRCNSPLETVDKAAVAQRLPSSVVRHHDQFQRCPTCGRIYWKGGHYRRMQDLIATL